MSLEEPEPDEGVIEAAEEVGVTTDGLDYDELADLVGDRLLDREEHVNAEGFVVRPDEVQDVLSTLKTEAGFDHCACVTAQEYDDRYESIYHLRKFDDPTQELSIVVPSPKDDPHNQSGARVYDTADWHEREAYDLIGIDYDASCCRRPGRATRSRRTTTRASPR